MGVKDFGRKLHVAVWMTRMMKKKTISAQQLKANVIIISTLRLIFIFVSFYRIYPRKRTEYVFSF